jgi:membrane protein
MKKVLCLGLLLLISLLAQVELMADNYKVTPRRIKDKIPVFGSELRTIMKSSDIVGYVHGTDTVDFVGFSYRAYVIKMKDGTQGYIDRSVMLRFNPEEGTLKSIASLSYGGKNIKMWLIYVLFGSCLLYFIFSLTVLKYLRWFNIFTNLFLLVSLGCIVLFGLLVAKCYINFWIFDMVYPGKETFERYFLTVVNMSGMLFCLFAIRQAISLKGSVWNARTGGDALVEIIYMLSMLAPVLAFIFRYFSGRLVFDSFSDYLSFQFSAMWFNHGFWAFLMGWTTFLYMLMMVIYTLYLLVFSIFAPSAWLWSIVLPATCVLVFGFIYFSLLQLEDVIMTALLPVGFMVFGIFQSGLNRVEWVHTHDVKDKYGQTIGRGLTAKPNVKSSHRPDRLEPF